MRRRDLMIMSPGGGDDDYYLKGNQRAYIQLPFKAINTIKITVECYGDGAQAYQNYCPIMEYILENQTTRVYYKAQNEVGMYRGNWTSQAVSSGKKFWLIVIDRVNYTFTVTGELGEHTNVGQSAPLTNDNYYNLILGDWIAFHRVTVEENGIIIYDIVASEDGNGTACMKDVLSGACYYDSENSAYLTILE